MVNLKKPPLSESEEMYLVTIARLVDAGEPEPIPLTRLAEELAIQPISVNQMVHKLDAEGLLRYRPYKGVELLPPGRQRAQRVLRYRQLWEVFLTERLGVSPPEAGLLACRFEHITPEDVGERLSAFLGRSSTAPHSLPGHQGAQETATRSLPDLAAGETAEIDKIELDAASVSYLQTQGLRPGARVTLLASAEGSLLLQTGKQRLTLSTDIAAQIMMKGER